MKILVIALDGFPYHYLKEQYESLPNLLRLMRNGSWANLVSTVPFITPTAWASFITGKNPGKHGVLGFFAKKSKDPSDIGEVAAANSIRGRTLWRILSDSGFPVGVFGVPMTYKPEALNGFMISGFPLPSDSKDYTFPLELADRLEEREWNFADVPTQAASKEHLDSFYEELKFRARQKTDAVLYLLESFKVEFFMVHYFETDKLLHDFINFRSADHCNKSDHHKYGSYVDEFMKYLDSQLGRVLSAVDASANLFVVSDHGLAPGNHRFMVDTWLLREGYLRVKRNPASVVRHFLFNVGVTPEFAFRILPEKRSSKLFEGFMSDYFKVDKPKANRGFGNFKGLLYGLLLDKRRDIDWQRTKVYSFGGTGMLSLYVNYSNENQSDPQELRESIAKKLQDFRYKGERVFDEVKFGSDEYTTKKEDDVSIPDVLAYDEHSEFDPANNPAYLASSRIVTTRYQRSNEAVHDRYGILIASGPDIANRGEIDRLSIMDVFPTILHYFGVGIENDVDGKVISNIYKDGGEAASRPPKYVEPGSVSSRSSIFSEAEEEELAGKLKSMGYI
jgi:predicted AlkP superfamily phosphohydrolase/phosphomutase